MNKVAAPVTEDAELAKVLEDMNNSMNTAATGLAPDAPATSIDDTAVPADSAAEPAYSTLAAGDVPADMSIDTPAEPTTETPSPTEAPGLSFEETTPGIPSLTLPPLSGPMSADGGDLESIKKDALTELRPLVDKLTLPADEKFDTFLLIIRSTDDKTLIPAVHEAAKSIEDETRRAQALLDVIKEIDFFSKPAS